MVTVLKNSDRIDNLSGMQKKYYKDGFLFKKDIDKEGLSEEFATIIFKCLNLEDYGIKYREYEAVRLNIEGEDCRGCKTEFLPNQFGTPLNMFMPEKEYDFKNIRTVRKSIYAITSYLEDNMKTAFNVQNMEIYLAILAILDAFMLNPDRKFSNINIDVEDNKLVPGYIFDNGMAYLSYTRGSGFYRFDNLTLDLARVRSLLTNETYLGGMNEELVKLCEEYNLELKFNMNKFNKLFMDMQSKGVYKNEDYQYIKCIFDIIYRSFLISGIFKEASGR